MNERSDVKFPMWRKKVDLSLLRNGVTPVPLWMCKLWGIVEDFRGINSSLSPQSAVNVQIYGKKLLQKGTLTCQIKGRGSLLFRLNFDEGTLRWLRQAYASAYLLFETQGETSQYRNKTHDFSDFLDIEYNKEWRRFILRDYYKQRPPEHSA